MSALKITATVEPAGNKRSGRARMVEMPPLTYTDISEQTGIPEGTLRQWQLRKKMPAPTERIGPTPLWDRLAIEDWLVANTTREVATA